MSSKRFARTGSNRNGIGRGPVRRGPIRTGECAMRSCTTNQSKKQRMTPRRWLWLREVRRRREARKMRRSSLGGAPGAGRVTG